MDKTILEQVYLANIEVHRLEASVYEQIHVEIYGSFEQKRIMRCLKKIDSYIFANQKEALDFGAGTGNITGKLLKLGYHVTAVDISPDMCLLLKEKFCNEIINGQLKVINCKVEDFQQGTFDLITCYSVLHHLPDYLGSIRKLAGLLRSGGIMLLDHEASPYAWVDETFLEKAFNFSNRISNKLFFRLKKIDVPSGYSLSDYWTEKNRHIDHVLIEQLFEETGFKFYNRIDYYINACRYPNPFFIIHRFTAQPDVSCWIAKK